MNVLVLYLKMDCTEAVSDQTEPPDETAATPAATPDEMAETPGVPAAEEFCLYSPVRLYGGGRRDVHPLELQLTVIQRREAGEEFRDIAADLGLTVGQWGHSRSMGAQ